MGGYSWTPKIRVDPSDGPDKAYDLKALLTDGKGPILVELDYPPVIEPRDDVNRALRPDVRGYRPTVALTFDVLTMADQGNLAEIEAALAEGTTDVYLSLNNGTTERAVVLIGRRGPTPLGGKNFVGARYRLELAAVDLIPEVPKIGSGNW